VVNSDIGDLLREVVNGFRHADPPIKLDAAKQLVVPVRPNAFRRSVTNLVNNAATHGGRVAIHAGRRGDAIEVTVDDDGPGIPESEREEVFKPFYRLDSSRNPETGGTGLGLTIARDLIRSHGGDISLEKSPQGGVRARLRLPS
jgi:two-component system osmolarity sensor histidine kinase EnvZ